MPDYKKLDEIDVLIFGKTSPEEDKKTSEYLSAYKAKIALEKKPRLITRSSKKLSAKAKS